MALAVAALVALSANCGGEEGKPMPQVVGKRLDVAKSDLKRVGLDEEAVEVVGGGALGVVDESNWTVCDQEPEPGTKGASRPRLIVDRVCGAEDTAAGAPSSTTMTPSTTRSQSTAPADTVTTSATSSPGRASLPNVVGIDLQDAQDLLQAQGFYNLRSHDARGLNRNQVLDRNWRVCDQQPRAGAVVTTDVLIDLGVVRDEENCPGT